VTVVWLTGLPPVQVLLLPLLVAALVVLVWSLTLVFASLNVRFRDVSNVVPFILQGGLFLTPVGYPLSSVDGWLEVLLYLNPFTGIIELWRWSLLGSSVDPGLVAVTAGVTLLALVLGWRLFSRLETRFADII
jgi:lipopolysaccharide transport system permease protein